MAAGCNVDPVNYFGNKHIGSMVQPSGQNRDLDDMSKQQRLQISLNYNYCQDEPARSASIPNPNPNPNHVSTGLRLSYDDDERNSSVTSASGSMTGVPPLILSLSGNIRTELNRQKQELDQYVKLQVIYYAIALCIVYLSCWLMSSRCKIVLYRFFHIIAHAFSFFHYLDFYFSPHSLFRSSYYGNVYSL